MDDEKPKDEKPKDENILANTNEIDNILANQFVIIRDTLKLI